MNTDERINQLIDDWNICPYEDRVDELFETFNACTEAYTKNEELSTRVIVTIVRDIRDSINPHKNNNLFHFTDLICDNILEKFKGSGIAEMPNFREFTAECKDRVYLKL